MSNDSYVIARIKTQVIEEEDREIIAYCWGEGANGIVTSYLWT